jgi:hypothetical protein
MSAIGYLETTEPAVKHFFDGLNGYDAMKPPSIAQYLDKNGLVQMSKSESKSFVQKHEDFFALEYARAILAGSILQVANTAIKMYSPSGQVTEQCKSLGVSESSPLAKMCVGREVHNIPIGLLIYAGRIQYNHWEEGEPANNVAKNVFRHLISVYYDDMAVDMAYELNYPQTRPVSHYIVRLELKWKSFDDYSIDIRSILA